MWFRLCSQNISVTSSHYWTELFKLFFCCTVVLCGENKPNHHTSSPTTSSPFVLACKLSVGGRSREDLGASSRATVLRPRTSCAVTALWKYHLFLAVKGAWPAVWFFFLHSEHSCGAWKHQRRLHQSSVCAWLSARRHSGAFMLSIVENPQISESMGINQFSQLGSFFFFLFFYVTLWTVPTKDCGF